MRQEETNKRERQSDDEKFLGEEFRAVLVIKLHRSTRISGFAFQIAHPFTDYTLFQPGAETMHE
jgi:hypothetical protein